MSHLVIGRWVHDEHSQDATLLGILTTTGCSAMSAELCQEASRGRRPRLLLAELGSHLGGALERRFPVPQDSHDGCRPLFVVPTIIVRHWDNEPGRLLA